MITILLNVTVIAWSLLPTAPDLASMVGSGNWRLIAEMARDHQYELAVATVYSLELFAALLRKNFAPEDLCALGVLHGVLATIAIVCMVLDANTAVSQGQVLANFLRHIAYKAAVAATSLAHALRILLGRH